MRMKKREFRIGELANLLQVERFVVRFWEKEFGIKTTRSTGKQRFYTDKDIEKFKLIKELLYEKGFTIAGAKKQISLLFAKSHAFRVKIIGSKKTNIDTPEHKITPDEIKDLEKQKEHLTAQIIQLKEQLLKLRELL